MIGAIYYGWYRDVIILTPINNIDILNGYMMTKCLDCDGTGKFEVPDGEIGITYDRNNKCPFKCEQCVACKGTGKIYINT